MFWVFASPVALFLTLALILYLPPVQRIAVDKAGEGLASALGLDVSVARVRLAFPLDLALGGVKALKENGDTVADVSSLRLRVRLVPLFSGRVVVDGAGIYRAKLDTRDFISDLRLSGRVGLLEAKVDPLALAEGMVKVPSVKLHDSDIYVALSDTAKEEEKKESVPWNMSVENLKVRRSRVALSMPGDSMRVYAEIERGDANGGHFDTGKELYTLKVLSLRSGKIFYAQRPQSRRNLLSYGGVPRVEWGKNGMWPGFSIITPLVGGVDLDKAALDAERFRYDGKRQDMSVNVGRISAKLHGAIEINGKVSKLSMSQGRMYTVKGLHLTTHNSRIDCDITADSSVFSGKGEGIADVRMKMNVGAEDIRQVGRWLQFGDIANRWPMATLSGSMKISGNAKVMRIDNAFVNWDGIARVSVKGIINNMFSDANRRVSVKFDAKAGDVSRLLPILPGVDRTMLVGVNGMRAYGDATVHGSGKYKASFNAVARGGGRISVKGGIDMSRLVYNLSARSVSFPIGKFVPGAGLGALNARFTAKGLGFDPFKRNSHADVEASVSNLEVGGKPYGNVDFKANLKGGELVSEFSVGGGAFEASGKFGALFGKNGVMANLTASMPSADLLKLGVAKDTLAVGAELALTFNSNAKFSAWASEGTVKNIRFLTPTRGIPAKDLAFGISTSPDTTFAHIGAGDLSLKLASRGGLDKLSSAAARLSRLVDKQLKARAVNLYALKSELPLLDLHLAAGKDNPMSKILKFKGIEFAHAKIDFGSSPERGLNGTFAFCQMRSGGMLIDTVGLALEQDSSALVLKGLARNYKRKATAFEVVADGNIAPGSSFLRLAYYDKDKRKGLDLGLRASVADSALKLSLFPDHPVIAYRSFTVNKANHITLRRGGAVNANVDLLADDGTALRIYGEPNDSVNDITVSAKDWNLSELSAVVPALPQLDGMFTGDVHLIDDHKEISAAAMVNIEDFAFEGAKLGNLGLETVYMPKGNGEHYANAILNVGGDEVMNLDGTYFTAGEKFEGTASLTNFPLELANGFMEGTDIALKGKTNGNLTFTGTTSAPNVNGSLSFDDSHVYSDVYGFDFTMDDKPVEFTDSRLGFDGFRLIPQSGANPMVLNGMINFENLENIALNLKMKANDFEFINSNKKAASLIYGKVYANYNGTVTGTLDNIFVRGQLEVLDRTDMTYVLRDSPLSVDSRLSDLVQFVSFTDTTTVVPEKDVPVGGFDLSLGISVSDAARFHCNLSEDGENYIDLEGGGELMFRITEQGDMRLTGRFTANSGEMKYSLPVIPLKTFNIVSGSYVDFTGDPMNPTLNISAKERVKATVTENDQPRSVAFDVGVAITKPLNQMGLEFTIEAPEDLGVQNELTAMTTAQRGKTAVALLATGMYVTDNLMASGTGFKASNALNAFLQSEIQNIAGNALKTIDLSVGMESGTSSIGTETTDYSFQFAKRFWNNRISVIIGGKVSTGQDAQNSAESFIDNISVEYRLDRTASRYVKVFYDRSTQDPLEGQLTKTGAGIVLRRKTDRLGELFIFKKKKTQ